MGWVILIIVGVVGFIIWMRKEDEKIKKEVEEISARRKMEDEKYYERERLDLQAQKYINSGCTHLKKGNIDQAIADFNKAIRTSPDMAAAYEGCSEAYTKKGDTVRAAEYYQKYQEAMEKATTRFREASERLERLKYS